jgi:protease II
MQRRPALLVLGGCHHIQVSILTQKIAYPKTTTVGIVDDYHGTKVPDPYRWLEDLDSKDTSDWVAEQNRLTDSYLAQQPIRAHFRSRIRQLWNFRKTDLPLMENTGARTIQSSSDICSPIRRCTT